MKKFLALTLMGWGLVCGLFAQNESIPYVDISQAQNEVETRNKEVAQLKSDNEGLGQANAGLRDQIATHQKQVAEITPLLETVRQKGLELSQVLSGIADKDMKSKAQEALDRNRSVESRLLERQNSLNKESSEKARVLSENLKTMDVNSAKIQEDEDRVALLTAAIAKTKEQQDQLNKYVSDVDAFLNNAESVLKK